MNRKIRLKTLLLILTVSLAAAGCVSAQPAEDTPSPSAAQEELDALKEENQRLQQELEELKNSQTEAEEEEEVPAAEEPAEPPAEEVAQPAAPTATAPAANTQKARSGKGPLAKYTVNVFDSTTPTASVTGKLYNGQAAYVFSSASGDVIGTIPDSELGIIIRQEGLSYAEADEQKAWFVKQFNVYRGLDGGEVESSAPSGGSSSSSEIDIEEFRKEVIRLTNIEREKAGLEPVTADDTAMEYAQIRAEELSVKFAHTRPNNESKIVDGLTFMENAARGQTSPQAVVNSWMKSDGHKATLLGEYVDYGNRIGVGCYQDGNGTIYWI